MRRRLPLVSLSVDERRALLAVRDHAVKPYQREWAAAVLKLGNGATIQQVAATGLHRRRSRHTVADWLNRYLAGGVVALTMRTGRGRKPAFSPSAAGRRDRQDAPPASPDAGSSHPRL